MAYPFYKAIQSLSQNMTKGNFGLWYNKFIPLNSLEKCEACGSDNKKESAVELYASKYNAFKTSTALKNIIVQKHHDQSAFCDSFSSTYEKVVFTAKLKTSLITGIGETHPHEISMIFAHSTGIPYIPASGIKGVVRFTHTLGLIPDIPPEKIELDKKTGELFFNDEDDWTDVSMLFGTQSKRGSVIFMDAYPESVPDIHIDIMNPHYGKYYSGESPPADYLDPNPLKFLTVAKDTVFIFRALVNKDSTGLIDKVKTAFKKALTEEGVGAKTAIGYGLFEIKDDVEVLPSAQILSIPMQEVKAIDKYITAIKVLKPTDAGPIGSKIDEALKKLESEEDKKAFAQAVKAHMDKAFKKSRAGEKLAPYLD